MADNEKLFAVADYDVRFLFLHPSRADCFVLPTFKNHAGFIFFLDKIIVKSFLILNNTHVPRKKVSSTRVSCILTVSMRSRWIMAVYPESWAGFAVKAKIKHATDLCGHSAEMKNEYEMNGQTPNSGLSHG